MMKLNPYGWLALILVVGSLVTGLWLHGRAAGVKSMQDKIALKDAAIGSAATALRASGAALREVNAEAARRIKAAEDQTKAEQASAQVLAAAYAAAQQQLGDDDARWSRARRKPGCAELQDADLMKTCGMTPR